MSAVFLVDNSVVQRLSNPRVRSAWDALVERGEVATCLPISLEAGYSARNAQDHARVMEFETRTAKVMLRPESEVVDYAIALQAALFAKGLGRAVGVNDLQIAATALHYGERTGREVAVVHYDSDFDHLANVWPTFDSRWIVPRGSVT